jgi:tRNA threonylcarbamoyladenosine modification (KEOPS) complex  Pcc1 subunit
MTDAALPWSASISVRLPEPTQAEWLLRSLRPEAAREVPRARAELRSPGPRVVEIAIEARDTGALRAALNTYLGWVHLSLATLPTAAGPRAP